MIVLKNLGMPSEGHRFAFRNIQIKAVSRLCKYVISYISLYVEVFMMELHLNKFMYFQIE